MPGAQTAINDRNQYRLPRPRDETAAGTELMGILNQIWWLLGFLMAAPILITGERVLADNTLFGVLLLALGLAVLLLPEYLRWRLLGGSSPFERVPLIGTRADQGEK